MHKMPASAVPPKIGQLVYLPVEVKSGMFPTEVRFYANFQNKIISGYALNKQIVGKNKLLAVVIDVSNNVATIALSGENAQTKVLEVPFDFVRDHSHL